MMSATVFMSPSSKPYLLCLTSPSHERAVSKNRGEWSSLFPLPRGPTEVPVELEHNIEYLRESVLVGAVTKRGDLIAVREAGGRVKILSLSPPPAAQKIAGLCCSAKPIVLASRLCVQSKASPTAIQFQESKDG